MYGCESWTVKKSECWRIDTLKLWCWKRFLRVAWTARRSNKSILKKINPVYSLEGLMLKLQYFGHMLWWADSLEKTLILGKIEGRRRCGQQRMSWLGGIISSMVMSLSKLWEIVKDRETWCVGVHGVTELDTTQRLNWTKLKSNFSSYLTFVSSFESSWFLTHFSVLPLTPPLNDYSNSIVII